MTARTGWPYPLIVWGADELRKYVIRHRAGGTPGPHSGHHHPD
jgi:hypothetical protein